MLKIKSSNARYLPLETLSELVVRVFMWADEFPALKEKILPLLNSVLKPAQQKLRIRISYMRGSKYTEAIASLDKRRDNAWRGIMHIVRANLLSFFPERREAAELLKQLLDLHKNTPKKEYDRQTGGSRSLVGQLRGEYKDAVEAIGLGFYVDEFENANLEFAEAINARIIESSKKVPLKSRDVCKEVGDALNMIFNYLNGLTLIEGAGKYEKPFNKLNVILDNFAVKTERKKREKEVSEGGEN